MTKFKNIIFGFFLLLTIGLVGGFVLSNAQLTKTANACDQQGCHCDTQTINEVWNHHHWTDTSHWGNWETGHSHDANTQNQHKRHSNSSWDDGICDHDGGCYAEQHRHWVTSGTWGSNHNGKCSDHNGCEDWLVSGGTTQYRFNDTGAWTNGTCPSPINGVLSAWGSCSVACGGGTQTRTYTQPQYCGTNPAGYNILSQPCNTQACDSAGQCPTACGLAASEIDNGEGGKTQCPATAACEQSTTNVGGPGDGLSDGRSDGLSSCPDCTKAPQGQVLGASTGPAVLGLSTTSGGENIALQLMQLFGALVSGVIGFSLFKKNS